MWLWLPTSQRVLRNSDWSPDECEREFLCGPGETSTPEGMLRYQGSDMHSTVAGWRLWRGVCGEGGREGEGGGREGPALLRECYDTRDLTCTPLWQAGDYGEVCVCVEGRGGRKRWEGGREVGRREGGGKEGGRGGEGGRWEGGREGRGGEGGGKEGGEGGGKEGGEGGRGRREGKEGGEGGETAGCKTFFT